MRKPANPAYFAIGIAFAVIALVYFGTGNTVGIAFLPVGITFLILAFQVPRPKKDARRGASDGGAPLAGTSGDGSGPADGGGRPDPAPTHGSDGDVGGGSDGGGGGGGD
ncbi:hypothetical protein [Arenivirga flava]|uniref:Uncharacterized protein n=1 Tax=Arenivirga flava TaxID=1930060 RepID=A0AA37UGI4_9MICO|nr:hypothetical protein [Arenivirga flava]GMA28915.1 hypothetical protein GCM10025874_21680 [Arenivirga flava]